MLKTNKWWSILDPSLESDGTTRAQSVRNDAIAWYKNDERLISKQFNDASWDGMVVRGNRFQRDIDILMGSVWADDPSLSVLTHLRDPAFIKAAEAYQVMSKKAWDETSSSKNIETAIHEALFGNTSFAKLEYDRFRQLPRVRWVEGQVALDPLGHGDLKRSAWIAEIVEIRFIDFWQDNTFSKEKREEVFDAASRQAFAAGEKFDLEEKIKLAWIWSKRGAKPWEKLTGRRLIVITDVVEDPLLEDEWPWPFLDHDTFPIHMLQINSLPDDWWGISLFEKNRPLYQHYNWAASFMMEDAKKACTRKIFYDDKKIQEVDKLTSGKHFELIAVRGDPRESIHSQDFGQGSPVVMQSFQIAKQLHDEQTGINEIARGGSVGDRATAEEVRTRQQNTSVVFKRISQRIDQWLQGVMRDYMLAVIYYVPQWSRIVDASGMIVQREYQPGLGPTFQPISLDEVVGLPDPDGLDPGYVIRAGVDAWVGVDYALSWIDQDTEQLKRDFSFTIEVGSTRSQHALEEQRTALTLLQSLMPIYMQFGCFAEVYELIRYFIRAQRLPQGNRFIPPQEKFMQGPLPYAPEPNPSQEGVDDASPIQQPAAQTLGLGFGPEGIQGFGNPNVGQGNNTQMAGRNPGAGLPGAA